MGTWSCKGSILWGTRCMYWDQCTKDKSYGDMMHGLLKSIMVDLLRVGQTIYKLIVSQSSQDPCIVPLTCVLSPEFWSWKFGSGRTKISNEFWSARTDITGNNGPRWKYWSVNWRIYMYVPKFPAVSFTGNNGLPRKVSMQVHANILKSNWYIHHMKPE